MKDTETYTVHHRVQSWVSQEFEADSADEALKLAEQDCEENGYANWEFHQEDIKPLHQGKSQDVSQ